MISKLMMYSWTLQWCKRCILTFMKRHPCDTFFHDPGLREKCDSKSWLSIEAPSGEWLCPFEMQPEDDVGTQMRKASTRAGLLKKGYQSNHKKSSFKQIPSLSWSAPVAPAQYAWQRSPHATGGCKTSDLPESEITKLRILQIVFLWQGLQHI